MTNAELIAEARRVASLPVRTDLNSLDLDVTPQVLLRTLADALERTEQERDKALALLTRRHYTCEVCWTSSFEPCEREEDCQLVHPHLDPGALHARCSYCDMADAAIRVEQERDEAVAREAVLRHFIQALAVSCPSCGKYHDEGHADSCACDHCAGKRSVLASPSPAAERLLEDARLGKQMREGMERGVAALKAGEMRPWPAVKKELWDEEREWLLAQVSAADMLDAAVEFHINETPSLALAEAHAAYRAAKES